MNKELKQALTGLAFLLVVFVIFALVAPLEKTPVFWIGFVFGIIALLVQGFVYYLTLGGERKNRKDKEIMSRVYSVPILKVGSFYLILQFIASASEMVASAYVPFWVAFVLNVVFLGMALAGLAKKEPEGK